MGLLGEGALIARLENEVAYLRQQLDLSRKREDALQTKVLALADARALADIARHAEPPARGAKPDALEHDESGRLLHQPQDVIPPWINALEGDDHIDWEQPRMAVRRSDAGQDAGADAEAVLSET